LTEVVVVNFVGSCIIALLAMWAIWSRVRDHTRTVEAAVGYVRKKTPEKATADPVVVIARALPLSDHMIKEVARAQGFEYAGPGSTGNGVRAFKFTRRPIARRKAPRSVR
jgi:hypothetical protein